MTDDLPEDPKRQKIKRLVIIIFMGVALLAVAGNLITGMKDWSSASVSKPADTTQDAEQTP